ncbi:hypothetical protein [uncultured Desulfobacter sp.]|uniref:hypothetical protein n=1 Tax=uncultured Desulfobacter sp. TaxID=240139 RepID=UPI0029F54647|nr:hypothetical protein [uncultured Desulfobacter sp.]
MNVLLSGPPHTKTEQDIIQLEDIDIKLYNKTQDLKSVGLILKIESAKGFKTQANHDLSLFVKLMTLIEIMQGSLNI